MFSEAADLGALQRWMQAVIVHPDGVLAGCASDDARGEISIDPTNLERIITRSHTLPATERLAIYASAYHARLLECLREEFPTLVHALGAELFDEFAIDYLQEFPSRSYTLHHLGANLPHYLAETCPTDEDPRWAAFLVDLATLERVYSDVFDNPGSEGLDLPSADRLAPIAPEDWPAVRLTPAPDLRLVELQSPVHEYIRAVRRNQNPVVPELAETFLAIHRRNYVVRRHPLTRPQYRLLAAIITGETIGDAIGKALEFSDSDIDDFAASLHIWFRHWTAEGFFRDIVVP